MLLCGIQFFSYLQKKDRLVDLIGDVIRVPCVLGQKYFCASINKTEESELKSRRKSKLEHLLMLHFCSFPIVIKRV